MTTHQRSKLAAAARRLLAACIVLLHPVLLLAAPAAPDATYEVGTLKVEHYRGSGTPMIFIPSLGAGSWIWGGLDRRFAPAHPVYSVTLAGFDGRAPAAAPMIDKAVADLERLIEQQHLDHPILVGHSLGGFVAFRFATAHPDEVGGVVGVEGFPVFAPLVNADAAARERAAQALAGQLAGGGTPAAFRASMQAFLAARMNDPEQAARLADLAARSDPQAVSEYVLEMLPVDLRPELTRLKSPVLAIAAVNSYEKGSSVDDIRAFYSNMLANARQHRVVVIPDAKHFVMLDQPDAVYAAIDGFMRDAQGGDAGNRAGRGTAGAEAGPPSAAGAPEAERIRRMLAGRFDRPGMPLEAGPIVVAGDAALADWAQGDAGGRALLRRAPDGRWSIVLCGGRALQQAATLTQAGLPPAQARMLAERLAAAESTVAGETMARFERLNGIVHMDGGQ